MEPGTKSVILEATQELEVYLISRFHYDFLLGPITT